MNKSRNKARVEIIKEIITTNINRLMFLLTHVTKKKRNKPSAFNLKLITIFWFNNREK